MKKEQDAAEMYTKLAAEAADASYRKTFTDLATMELGHKARLESVFADMAYPEEW
jgi:rubrerythrin